MQSKRIMRGGNANVRPIEYYGGNSGNYSENPVPVGGTFAYGDYHPVSHGVVHECGSAAGPNIGVYHGGLSSTYTQQTGGAKRQKAGCIFCGCRSKKTGSSNRRSRRGRSGSRSRSGSRRRSARDRSGSAKGRSRSRRRSARGRSGSAKGRSGSRRRSGRR